MQGHGFPHSEIQTAFLQFQINNFIAPHHPRAIWVSARSLVKHTGYQNIKYLLEPMYGLGEFYHPEFRKYIWRSPATCSSGDKIPSPIG